MTSYINPPSPSEPWAINPYLAQQPELIQAIDPASLSYSSLPSPPSDGASTPRTPPQPAQPALPNPKSPKRSSRKPPVSPVSSDTPPAPTKSAVPNGPPAFHSWAQPTISTFSASSSSFNHIHIVQPYLQGSAASSTGATDLFANSGIHFVGMGGGPPSDGRPPRPANAWILYRSAKMKVLKDPQSSGQPRRTQADISKLIAEMWKNETSEVRQYYEAMSDMKKAEHLAQYPTYRFQPMKKADKEKARLEKKAQKERERAEAALTRSRGSRSRRRPATSAADDSEQLDGQIAGFPPGTQVLAWGTTPTTPSRSTAFQPYLKPSKRPSSLARKTQTPPEQSQPSVENTDGKPTLPPLNTASVPPSTVSPSALSGVAPLAVTADPLQFPQQDWSQATPYSAHPDYSYPSVPSLLTNFGESTSVLPSGWPISPSDLSAAYAPPSSACSTSAPSLPQAHQSDFLTLFTEPGTAFTAPLPSDFDCSSGTFSYPELGQITDLDQLFGPGGLDPAAFESFSEPLLAESSTASSQPLHQQQPVMSGPAHAHAPPAPQSFYEHAPLSAGLDVPVQYQEFTQQSETSVEVVTSAEATPAYGLDTSAYFSVAPHSYTPSAPVVYAHAAATQPPRKQSVASPPDVYSYGGHYDLSAYQTSWSVHS